MRKFKPRWVEVLRGQNMERIASQPKQSTNNSTQAMLTCRVCFALGGFNLRLSAARSWCLKPWIGVIRTNTAPGSAMLEMSMIKDYVGSGTFRMSIDVYHGLRRQVVFLLNHNNTDTSFVHIFIPIFECYSSNFNFFIPKYLLPISAQQ